MTIQPAMYDFPPVLQGSDWRIQLQLFSDKAQETPIDLSGCEIDMHIRDVPAADASDQLLLALSTRATGDGAGRITFVDNDPTQGKIQLDLSANDTTVLVWEGNARAVPAIAVFWYDIELTNADGRVQRIMRGKWPFDAEITKQTV